MNDRYSSGPFSRVHFIYGRDGLHCYRYRMHNVMDKGSLIHTISSVYDGGPRFHEIYERTSR